MKTLETLALAGTVLITSLFNSNSQLYAKPNFSNNPKISSSLEIKKDIQGIEKRQRYTPENLVMNYDEWKNLIEKPESNEAKKVRSRLRVISELDSLSPWYKSLINHQTVEERKLFDSFWDSFTLDIKKIIPQGDKDSKLIYDLAFPIILEMQFELDKIYGEPFTHSTFSNLTAGEKYVIYQHFKYEGKYISEGNKMPDYLGLKDKLEQIELEEKEEVKKEKTLSCPQNCNPTKRGLFQKMIHPRIHLRR